jgi:hypothetical protein
VGKEEKMSRVLLHWMGILSFDNPGRAAIGEMLMLTRVGSKSGRNFDSSIRTAA